MPSTFRRAAIGLAAALAFGCSSPRTHQDGPIDADLVDDAAYPDAPLPPFESPVPVALPANAQPYLLFVADFNGDGRDDLAFVQRNFGSISILVNTTPDGAHHVSFMPPISFSIGQDALQAAVADLNDDGRPDIAVANPVINKVSVLLNTTVAGQLAFADRVDFAAGGSLVGEETGSVAAGDVDGDGKPDLVVGSFGNPPMPGNLAVLVNQTASGATTPTFAPQINVPGGLGLIDAAIVDVDGDGRRDLVIVDEAVPSVVVLGNTTLAPGSPTFEKRLDGPAGANASSIVSADLDLDGKPDFAVANEGEDTVSILFNTTTAPAQVSFATVQVRMVGFEPRAVVAGLLDGLPFLATANDTRVSLLHGPGLLPTDFQVGMNVTTIATADFNRDGKADLVVCGAGGNGMALLLGR